MISPADGWRTGSSYGPDRQRKQQIASYSGNGTSGTESTIYFAGLFEIESTPAQTHYKHLIGVPGGTRIIYDIQSVSGVKTSYLTADHLGSANLMLASSGVVLANLSFSAYGYRRAGNWSGPLANGSADYTAIAATTRRGFSGAFHEMLDNLNLIHMNGRVYDPVIGRFLSPDPLSGTVGQSQSWNPYSYVMNRPLSLADPSGYASDDTPAPKLSDDGGGSGSTGGGGGSSGGGTVETLSGIEVSGYRPLPELDMSSLLMLNYASGPVNTAPATGGGSGKPPKSSTAPAQSESSSVQLEEITVTAQSAAKKEPTFAQAPLLAQEAPFVDPFLEAIRTRPVSPAEFGKAPQYGTKVGAPEPLPQPPPQNFWYQLFNLLKSVGSYIDNIFGVAPPVCPTCVPA